MKKQTAVARSSTEAEHRALAATTCELKWLKGLLRSLGIFHTDPMTTCCDSVAAFYIAYNPFVHERTKDIEVDSLFFRDKFFQGVIRTHTYQLLNNRLIYTPRCWESLVWSFYFPSWAFHCYMLQLDGGC